MKALWKRAEALEAAGLDSFRSNHDALGVLELLEATELGSDCRTNECPSS